MPAVAKAKAPHGRKRAHAGGEAVEMLEMLQTATAAQAGGDALSEPAIEAALRPIMDSTPNAKLRTSMEKALRNLRDDVQTLSESKSLLKADSAGLDKRIRPTERERVALSLDEPLKVSVIGSFLLGLWRDHADVALHAPATYFGDRDVGNYKYHRKRVALLAHVARHLKTKQWIVSWAFPHGLCKPVLAASRENDDSSIPSVLHIHVSCPPNTFPARLLSADRRNIHAKGESAVVNDPKLATPAYNGEIAADSAQLTHLRILHAARESTPAFLASVRLVRAWMLRRALDFRGTFVPAALIVDTLAVGAAPSAASAQHLFRAALVRVRKGELERLVCGGVHVCSPFDPAMLRRAQKEAAWALQVIDAECAVIDPWRGTLPALFITARGGENRQAPVTTLFDAFVRFEGDVSPGEFRAVMREALVDTGRARSVEYLDNGLMGLELVSVYDANRKVDSCSSKEAEARFKQFWGDKVVRRRFNQGGIKSVVIWEGGRNTLQDIVTYVAEQYFEGISSIKVLYAQLETAAELDSDDSKSEGLALRLANALDGLGKSMRELEGLPLRITSVQGASPHLRRAAVHPPRPHPHCRYIDPVECVAEFESTKQWPQDPVALSAAKAGFYVLLREALKEKGVSSDATVSFLDAMLGGFVFRVRLRVVAEEKCYPDDSPDRARLIWQTRGSLDVHSVLRRVESPCARVAQIAKRWLGSHLLYDALGERREELVELLVTKALEGPHPRPCTSSLSGFARFLDLLAHYPWEAFPVVIAQIADTMEEDKTSKAMQDNRSLAQMEKAIEQFERRKRKPPLAINVGCADSESWYDFGPSAPVVERLAATAAAALRHIDAVVQGEYKTKALRTLFRTPVEGVYQLKLELVRGVPSFGPSSRNAKRPVVSLSSSRAGLDNVERLLAVLEEELGDFAWFARDRFDDTALYVAWKDVALQPRPLTVRGMRFAMPAPADAEVDTDTPLLPDRAAMVAEIQQIAHGAVERVVLLAEDSALQEYM